MSAEFDKLKATQKEMGITDENQVNMTWLRESNEKLRKDVLKVRHRAFKKKLTLTNVR